MSTPEVIVQVGAGEGTISLIGLRTSHNSWRFMRETNESFHADLLSDEDKESLTFNGRHGLVSNLSEGLKLLDEYPWHLLYPIKVHPEFKHAVFEAVVKLSEADGRHNRNIYKWKIACGIPLD